MDGAFLYLKTKRIKFMSNLTKNIALIGCSKVGKTSMLIYIIKKYFGCYVNLFN